MLGEVHPVDHQRHQVQLREVLASRSASAVSVIATNFPDTADFLVDLDTSSSLTGPEGLLKQFTKSVLETVLNEEMTEHLGHEKNRAAADRESGNVRNGTRPKTVLTHATGEVELEVPRDRDGTFEPVIVKKRQRPLSEVDEIVLSLYARDLTTGEISAHFAQIYGASVVRRRQSDH